MSYERGVKLGLMEKKEPKNPEVTKFEQGEGKEAPIMHTFTEKPSSSLSTIRIVIAFVVVACLGIVTGFGVAQFTHSGGDSLLSVGKGGLSQSGKTFGSDDLETFKDTAEGELEEGGIEGEGQYHLVRPGGESQNVYLTSSLVDLSQFVGKKIKVWGQTQAAQRAGWLMDVGRVEVL